MPKANVYSITTGRQIDVAKHTAAPPTGQVEGSGGAPAEQPEGPDGALLTLCDDISVLKRECDRLIQEWRDAPPGTPRENGDAWKVIQRAEHAMRSPLLKLSRLHAATPAGIFAKARIVRKCGTAAAGTARSLAADLLSSTDLRRVMWPATREASG